MSNFLFNKAKESFLKGELNWLSDIVKISLIDTSIYTVDQVNHQFLSDIAPSSVVASSGALSGKTASSGAADANDVVFSSGIVSAAQAVIIWQDTGSSATSRLIAYIDTASGLPFAATGSPVSVLWDEGENKIFKL